MNNKKCVVLEENSGIAQITLNRAEALEFGLVNTVVESDELCIATEELVQEILTQAPIVVDFRWQELHRGLNMTLEESTQLGVDYFSLVATNDDFREGTSSFIQKKDPSYLEKQTIVHPN